MSAGARVADDAETQEGYAVVPADLGDGRGLHVAGQRVGVDVQHAGVLRGGGEELVAGADEPAVQGRVRAYAAGGAQQRRVGVEALRQALDLPAEVALAAPHVVVGGLGADHDVADGDRRRESAGAAGIDDAVRPVPQDHLRGGAGGGGLADAGLHGAGDAGAAQGLEFRGHGDDQARFHRSSSKSRTSMPEPSSASLMACMSVLERW